MALTIQDLGALGEFLGSIAVLATLVYLALQTRQNTMAIGAQLDAARIGSLLNINLTAATSSDLQEALNRARFEPLEIEHARLYHFWSAQFYQFQWNWIHARRGLMPTFNEASMARAVTRNFNEFHMLERWWEARKVGFHADFVEWVEEQRAKATGQEA